MADSASKHSDLIEGLFQRTPTGLCIIDMQLRCVQANAAYAQIAEQTPDAMIGRPVSELMPGEAGREFTEVVSRVLETAEPALDIEVSSRTFEGADDSRSWLLNVHPLHRGGKLSGAVASYQDISHLRHAEEVQERQLREIESLYRNAPVGLSFTDRDLRYLRVNQVVADLNGISIEEMLGKTYRDLAPDSADDAERLFKDRMDKGLSVRAMEVRAVPPADPGNEHVFLMSMEPVRDSKGEVIGQVSAIQDVTELRHTQGLATRRLQELEILYAHVNVGLCRVNADLVILGFNDRFARFSDVPSKRLIGTPMLDVLPGQIAAQLRARLAAVLRGGDAETLHDVRGCLPGMDDVESTWSVVLHPARSEDGTVSGVVTVWQDVTALARREREAASVRDRLVKAQGVSHTGSWEWDLLEGRVWWSPELYEIFGEQLHYEPSYLDFFEHVHPADRRKAREQLERTLSDDNPYRVSYRIVRPDGSKRELFTTAQVERTADGTPARLVGTCQDITDRATRPRAGRGTRR